MDLWNICGAVEILSFILLALRLAVTLVNVNAPVVATTSWWLHLSAQVVAQKIKKSIPVDFIIYLLTCIYFICDDTLRIDHR